MTGKLSIVLWFLASGCSHAEQRPRSPLPVPVPSTVDVTVNYMWPASIGSASIIFSGELKENPITARPDSEGAVVFRAVAPGKYRIEAHHPKGIATFKEIEVDGTKPVFTTIGLPSAFLYVADRGPEPIAQYRDAMNAVFAQWRGPERLAWVIDRPSSYGPEVMVGVAGDATSGYVGFALHASARISDVIQREERAARGGKLDEHLRRLPSLDEVEARPSVRAVSHATAMGIACTWREAVRQARPQSESFPETVDGNLYTFEVRDEHGQTLMAETENLGDHLLTQPPRYRAMALFRDVHEFADGHISANEFESHVDWAIDPACKPHK